MQGGAEEAGQKAVQPSLPKVPENQRVDWPDLANVVLIGVVIAYAVTIASTNNGVHLGPGSVSAQVRDLLWFALLCGLASFATLETLKKVFGLRGAYQRKQIADWLYSRLPWEKGYGDPFAALLDAMGVIRAPSPPEDVDARPVARSGATYGVPGDQRRIFDLPIEQLAAQVGAAADIALDPSERMRYASLTASLVGAPLSKRWLDAKAELQSDRDPLAEGESLAYAQRIRIGVDQMQISIGGRWCRYLQGAAIWIAGAFGIGLTHAANFSPRAEPRYTLAAVVLGGLIAWTARDIAAVLERARRPPV